MAIRQQRARLFRRRTRYSRIDRGVALRATNVERSRWRLLLVNLQTGRTFLTNDDHDSCLNRRDYSIRPSIEPESANELTVTASPSRRMKSSAAVMPLSESSRLF